MTQVSFQLPDDLHRFVQQSVQSGGYRTMDEFFISLLSHFKAQAEAPLTAADELKLERLRRDIQIGIDQLDRGEGKEMNWDAFLAERHRALAATR